MLEGCNHWWIIWQKTSYFSSLSEPGRQGWSWLFPSPILHLHLTELWDTVILLSPKSRVSQDHPYVVFFHINSGVAMGLCWLMRHQQVWSKHKFDKHLCFNTVTLGAQLPRKQICAILLERWCAGESRYGSPNWPPALWLRPLGKSQLPAILLFWGRKVDVPPFPNPW